jgi:hypothetical protein
MPVSPLSGARGVREVSAGGDGDGIGEADGGLMLPVVLRPAPGEGISARLGIPQVVKSPYGAPVGKNVKEAQELLVNSTRGRHHAGQKGVSDTLPAGIGLAIPCHLGARRGLETLVDIGVAELPIAAHVRDVVAAELLGADNVDDQMPIVTMLTSLMSRSPRPVVPLGLLTDGIFWCCVDRPASWHIFCSTSRIISWASFVLPVCFLQVWI